MSAKKYISWLFIIISFSSILLLKTRHKDVQEVDIDYFLSSNFNCKPLDSVSYSSKGILFFSSLEHGMHMMYDNQQLKAWESWNYCFESIEDSRYLPVAYLGIGSVLGEVDAESSLLFLKKALQLAQDLPKSNKKLEYCCLNQLVRLLVRQAEYGVYDQKIDYLVKTYCKMADDILSNPLYHVEEASISASVYRTAIESLLWLGDEASVSKYMKKLESNSTSYADDELTSSYIDILQGVEAFVNEKYDCSITYFNKAIVEIGHKSSYLHPDLELPYAYLANVYSAQEEYDQAIDCMQRSIRSLLSNNYTSQDEEFRFIPFKEIKNWENTYNVILCCIKLQEFHIGRLREDNTTDNLAAVKKLSAYTKQLIKAWFFNAADPNTLLYATKLIKQNNALTVGALYDYSPMEQKDIDEAFLLCTESGAFYLNYLMEMKVQLNSEHFDHSLLKSINELTVDFLSEGDRSTEGIQDIDRSIQLLQEKVSAFQSEEYSLDQLILNNNLPKISDSSEAVLKYFVDSESVYAFCFTKTTKSMKRINLVGFENAVNALQRSLKGGARRSLAQHRLYDELIAPFENDLQDVKQLTILSDGNLNKVPFGALLDRDDMFLISKFAITYSYSLRGLDDESLSRISPILTVAPVFDGTDDRVVDKSTRPSDFAETLIPLNESLYEIDSIASMYEKLDYPYTVLASCYATKSNFLEASKNNAIIHIATHGISTKQQESGLYFYPISEDVKDFFLPLSELYTMDIDADLVVLSACQTAVGEIKDGEGVMSLPRGFIYAGASNVMASLWQVNDAKTKYMMVQFYKHLIQDSCSYSLALQKAKIDCVNRGFLPIDWAGFILVSD